MLAAASIDDMQEFRIEVNHLSKTVEVDITIFSVCVQCFIFTLLFHKSISCSLCSLKL